LATRGIDFPTWLSHLHHQASATFTTVRNHTFAWPQWARFFIFRTFIRPKWEFGAPLISAYLRSNRRLEAFDQLVTLEEDCIRWIYGLDHKTKVTITHYNGLGISKLETRFQELAASFFLHLSRLFANESELHQVSMKLRQQGPVLPTQSLLLKLQVSPLHNAYKQACTKWATESSSIYYNHPGHSTNRLLLFLNASLPDTARPPELPVFITRQRLAQEACSFVTASVIDPASRTGSMNSNGPDESTSFKYVSTSASSRYGTGMDRTLLIPFDCIRAAALRWRRNTFASDYTCHVCHSTLTKQCPQRCRLLDDCIYLMPRHYERYSTNNFRHEATFGFNFDPNSYTLVDDLLNNQEWKTFAQVILYLLQLLQPHQSSRSQTILTTTIAELQSEITSFDHHRTTSHYINPSNSASQSTPFASHYAPFSLPVSAFSSHQPP
jgi:hypothetical protein